MASSLPYLLLTLLICVVVAKQPVKYEIWTSSNDCADKPDFAWLITQDICHGNILTKEKPLPIGDLTSFISNDFMIDCLLSTNTSKITSYVSHNNTCASAGSQAVILPVGECHASGSQSVFVTCYKEVTVAPTAAPSAREPFNPWILGVGGSFFAFLVIVIGIALFNGWRNYKKSDYVLTEEKPPDAWEINLGQNNFEAQVLSDDDTETEQVV
mmetsp:Transcript_4639/g.5039  ORF Transcript_4639/g.5039 Transcript_4639/m.5039 type:complete len:213 (+) Transcript_4639:1-639(+)